MIDPLVNTVDCRISSLALLIRINSNYLMISDSFQAGRYIFEYYIIGGHDKDHSIELLFNTTIDATT